MTSLQKFIKGFSFAFTGISTGSSGRNFRVHLLFASAVIFFGLLFQISLIEWLLVIFCIAAVLSAELINTAIEETCNVLKNRLKLGYSATTDPRNLAAAAVLILAVASAIIGFVIFIPKFFALIP